MVAAGLQARSEDTAYYLTGAEHEQEYSFFSFHYTSLGSK
jgi:hypothetical protein